MERPSGSLMKVIAIVSIHQHYIWQYFQNFEARKHAVSERVLKIESVDVCVCVNAIKRNSFLRELR